MTLRAGPWFICAPTDDDWREWQARIAAERAATTCTPAREHWRRCRWWQPQPHMSGPYACRAPEGPVCREINEGSVR